MNWHRVVRHEELAENAWTMVTVERKPIGLLRRGGECHAVLNFCPHAGAPVCRGDVTGRVTCDERGRVGYDAQAATLRCPWHRWEFDLSSGRAVTPIRERLKTFPTRVVEGMVEVLV